jgi:hypothetical protein
MTEIKTEVTEQTTAGGGTKWVAKVDLCEGQGWQILGSSFRTENDAHDAIAYAVPEMQTGALRRNDTVLPTHWFAGQKTADAGAHLLR